MRAMLRSVRNFSEWRAFCRTFVVIVVMLSFSNATYKAISTELFT